MPGKLIDTILVYPVALRYNELCLIFFCSDDRSAEVFRRTLEAATQMQAVLTAGSKPNCLIIDEIDGAPLVSLCMYVCMCVGVTVYVCTV